MSASLISFAWSVSIQTLKLPTLASSLPFLKPECHAVFALAGVKDDVLEMYFPIAPKDAEFGAR